MSKPANDSSDHWKRLAAELGLDLGPEPEPVAEPTPAEPVARSRRRPAEVEEPEPPVAVEDLHATEEPFVAVIEDEQSEVVESSPIDVPAESSVEPPSDEEKPRRRGRRRLCRKKGEDRPDEAAVTKTATADDVDDDGDSPADAVRDWNIPSWNDLIASLHRPER